MTCIIALLCMIIWRIKIIIITQDKKNLHVEMGRLERTYIPTLASMEDTFRIYFNHISKLYI